MNYNNELAAQVIEIVANYIDENGSEDLCEQIDLREEIMEIFNLWRI